MSRLILRRLAIGVPTLLIIITLSFFMMRLAPGGPFDQERPIPPEILRNIEKAYHLDEPLVQQYLRYLGGVLRGDFGPSYRTKDFTVGRAAGRRVPRPASRSAGWPCCWRRAWACSPASSPRCATTAGSTIR